MGSSVVYDAVLGSGFTLRQVRSCGFSPNNTIVQDFVSGGVDPSGTFLVSGRPEASLVSNDLAGVIGGIDEQAGLHIGSGTGSIKLPWNGRAVGGTFLGSGAHFQITADRGLVVVNSYSANQGDQGGATANLMTHFYATDSLVAPATAAANASLSSQSYNASHRLGPLYVNGTQLTGVTGVTINTGISIEKEETDGDIWPTALYLVRRQPTMQIRFRHAHQLATYGPLFAAMESAVQYFRKRSPGGSVVADTTEEHCSFTFADGMIDVQSVSANDNSAAEPSITLVGEALTVSAAAAIP